MYDGKRSWFEVIKITSESVANLFQTDFASTLENKIVVDWFDWAVAKRCEKETATSSWNWFEVQLFSHSYLHLGPERFLFALKNGINFDDPRNKVLEWDDKTIQKNTETLRKLFPMKWAETKRQIVKANMWDPNNFGEMVVNRHSVLEHALRIDVLDYALNFCPGLDNEK